jgi:8-oxo-dGTP pyrophosphatase MutT (NUDIX family)
MHILDSDDLRDADTSWPLVSSEVMAQGKVTRYVRDVVRAPDTRSMTREYLKASQAVGVIAMDDQGHVVVLSQYRHPVQGRLIELPAGLVDVEGEPVLDAAKRELEEEANLAAADWRAVTSFYTSPGMSDEIVHIFLARGLSPTAVNDDFAPEPEEAAMTLGWAPLADLVSAVLQARIRNSILCLGVLAVWNTKDRWDDLPDA